jgi:hypothetical protein
MFAAVGPIFQQIQSIGWIVSGRFLERVGTANLSPVQF